MLSLPGFPKKMFPRIPGPSSTERGCKCTASIILLEEQTVDLKGRIKSVKMRTEKFTLIVLIGHTA